ncbi:MAG: hypothetical protein ACQGTM_11940 [bacterium]
MRKSKVEISRMGIKQESHMGKTILKATGIILLAVIAVALFIFGFRCLELHIRNEYLINTGDGSSVATWISSLASYWGGILGGAVSGLLALGGTFIIINYYRKSDLTNKRLENQPFLNIMVKSKSNQPPKESVLFELGSGNMCIYIQIVIKNIGRGFAQTLVYYDGSNFGGNEFRNTIESGRELDKQYVIKIKYKDSSVREAFGIMFMDCFSNEYIQSFEITADYDDKVAMNNLNILCDYPSLTATAFK